MSDNSFQPPQVMANMIDGEDPKLDRTASILQQTKPWVRFISVLMFISGAFMVLGGLFIMGGGLQMLGGYTKSGESLIGVVYLVMAPIYIIPAVFLWKYADRIALFAQERSTSALASALESQKSFWKFVGVSMLIVLILYVVIFAFAIVVGIATSM